MDPPTLADYTHQYLRSVVAQVGHCLGLRHNFKARTMLTTAQLQDKAMTAQYGVAGSVMDYLPANIPPLNGKRADLCSCPPLAPTTSGPSSTATRTSAATPSQERIGLAAIAGRSHEFGHAFASDEDADALDPTITRFDLGANPLDFRIAMVERAHTCSATLEYRYPTPGQPYYELPVCSYAC